MKKKLLLAVALVIATVLVLLIVVTPKKQPETPPPNPNGYDDFIKATTLLESNPPDWQSLKDEEQHQALLKLAATNRAALELLKAGLSKECRVPAWGVNGTNFPHINDLARFRALAQSLVGASKLSLIESRTNEAAVLAIDCIRFGNECYRGGVLIDGLVGIAIKSIGLSSLKPVVDGMDLDATRQALSALEQVSSRGESADEILKRERQWARLGRFGPVNPILLALQRFQDRKAMARASQKFVRINRDIRVVQLQLATHAYELEHGKPPARARELVPQYLKAIPLDPETGKELPLN
jgi:hypothetical protein